MNCKIVYHSFVLVITTSMIGINAYDMEKFETIINNKKDRTFLLSFPRSGNTWLRYCIEYTTQRPSFNRFNLKHDVNFPLGWSANFPIDIIKSPIEKVHLAKELQRTQANDQTDALILIVRNPKEALIRVAGKTVLMQAIMEATCPKNLEIYFEALTIFDSWRSPKKMLVYYEDLLQNPQAVLESILAFLNETTECLPEFLANYQVHKKKCLSIYKVSASGGDDLLYHSKSLSGEERKNIDYWVQKKVPALWDKYLGARYAEKGP